jgi:hypothetical protein
MSHSRSKQVHDDSSASGSPSEIEVSSRFYFNIHVSFLRVGPYKRDSGGRTETKET